MKDSEGTFTPSLMRLEGCSGCRKPCRYNTSVAREGGAKEKFGCNSSLPRKPYAKN